jgi:hypothetical protein
MSDLTTSGDSRRSKIRAIRNPDGDPYSVPKPDGLTEAKFISSGRIRCGPNAACAPR